jgi:hypothetical protein
VSVFFYKAVAMMLLVLGAHVTWEAAERLVQDHSAATPWKFGEYEALKEQLDLEFRRGLLTRWQPQPYPQPLPPQPEEQPPEDAPRERSPSPPWQWHQEPNPTSTHKLCLELPGKARKDKDEVLKGPKSQFSSA